MDETVYPESHPSKIGLSVPLFHPLESARREGYRGDMEEKPQPKEKAKVPDKNFPHWIWPIGLAVAGIGAAATVLLRGCWHRNMSWPVRYRNYAYQTCNDCGIMRLFDERRFRPYGPYGYDLDELIAGHERRRAERVKKSGAEEEPEDDFVI